MVKLESIKEGKIEREDKSRQEREETSIQERKNDRGTGKRGEIIVEEMIRAEK